jgi:hypothetical protein
MQNGNNSSSSSSLKILTKNMDIETRVENLPNQLLLELRTALGCGQNIKVDDKAVLQDLDEHQKQIQISETAMTRDGTSKEVVDFRARNTALCNCTFLEKSLLRLYGVKSTEENHKIIKTYSALMEEAQFDLYSSRKCGVVFRLDISSPQSSSSASGNNHDASSINSSTAAPISSNSSSMFAQTTAPMSSSSSSSFSAAPTEPSVSSQSH